MSRNNKKVETKFRKMFIYMAIVNYGYGDTIAKLLQDNNSNAQIICLGRGTANTEVMHILGLENNRKDVVMAFVDEKNVREIKSSLQSYFSKRKKHLGIAFTIPLTTIVGEKIYHFLTNTL